MRTRTTRQVPPAMVLCTGPEPALNRDGDEIPMWLVFASDKEREPVSRIYKVYGYWRARLLAATMADDRHLPLEDEANRGVNRVQDRRKFWTPGVDGAIQ